MNITGRPPYSKGAKPIVSKPLRDAAKGATCTLRIPGVCLGTTETVVGCHLRLFSAAGMAQKPHDLFMVDACAACHAKLDNRASWDDVALGWDDVLRALMETQSRRIAAGLIRTDQVE